MRRIPEVLLASALMFGITSTASAGSMNEPLRRSAPDAAPSVRLLSVSTKAVLAPLRMLFGSGAGTSLSREAGWTAVGFPLRDHGFGLYLEVAGQTEIERIEVVFEDGEMQQIDLEDAHVYGGGMYRIAAFDGVRDVMLVRLKARAHSPRARVHVLLQRDF